MKHPIELHPRDRRPLSNQQEDLTLLKSIQEVIEGGIGSYAIGNTANIYDEENEQIIRKLDFSKGLKSHQLVIAPDGFIRYLSRRFPGALLRDIHNVLVGRELINTPER